MCGVTQPFGIMVFVDWQGDWFTSLDSVIFCTSFVSHYSPSQTFQSASSAVSSFSKIRGAMWLWYHCDQGAWVRHIQLQGLNHRPRCLPIHLTRLGVSQGHWMHVVSKLFSTCGGSNLRPCGPKPDKWWCHLSHRAPWGVCTRSKNKNLAHTT